MGTSKRALAMISILHWSSREGLVVVRVKLKTKPDDQDIQTSDHHPGLVMGTSARCNHMLSTRRVSQRSPSTHQNHVALCSRIHEDLEQRRHPITSPQLLKVPVVFGWNVEAHVAACGAASQIPKRSEIESEQHHHQYTTVISFANKSSHSEANHSLAQKPARKQSDE